VDVRLNQAAIDQLLTGQDTARMLVTKGQPVKQAAKRFAPTSPDGSHGRRSGHLRSQIRADLGQDSQGLYIDVSSPATTPTGEPYGLFQEIGTRKMPAQPHLRPALDVLGRD
jgi:HK97 gp10 family phage protein